MKDKEPEKLKHKPCLFCGKENPVPYARYHAGVVCSKHCDLNFKSSGRGKYARTLPT